MFEAQTAETFADDAVGYEEPLRSTPRAPEARIEPEADYIPSHYAAGTNRRLIWLVIAAHALVLWAVMQFDVVGRHQRAHPLQVTLVPLDIAPPPKAQQLPKQADVKVQAPVVAPPAIVSQPIATQPPVMSVPVPQTPAPPPIVSAPSAPVMAQAAPIVPPDGFAANLGNTPPSYPIESRRAHEEGTVRLRVVISPQGTVQEITIAKSSGFDALDDAALRAVRKWRFKPGTQAGVPIEAVGFLSIPFKLTRP